MFGHRKPRYTVTTTGVVDLPAIGVDLTTGQWWGYEQDGSGGGGPLSDSEGAPVAGSVVLDSWQRAMDYEVASRGWWWGDLDWAFVMNNGVQVAHRPLAGV